MPDDIECHLVMCLTKPRLSYNGGYTDDRQDMCGWTRSVTSFLKPCRRRQTYPFFFSPFTHFFSMYAAPGFAQPAEDCLTDAKGECVICLEDLCPGDIIARLPCLCIYHKGWVYPKLGSLMVGLILFFRLVDVSTNGSRWIAAARNIRATSETRPPGK